MSHVSGHGRIGGSLHPPGATFLLVSGLPGSGKSSYCRWLAREHGYLHIDVDLQEEPCLNLLASSQPGALQDMMAGLLARNPCVAFDWGFPVQFIDRVRLMKHQGAHVWWFDGDEKAAEQSALARPWAKPEEFHHQLESIRSTWSAISKVFQGQILEVVGPGPSYTSSEELYALMGRPR